MEGMMIKKKVQILIKALLLASVLVFGLVQDVAAKKYNLSMESAGLVEDELEMASMTASRMLVDGKNYVSYGALEKETVPCGQPGAPYYKCRQGGATNNPYSRDCNHITKCRR